MAAAVKKRLRIFAGPNGSGKSTITKIVLDYGDRNLSPVIPVIVPCHCQGSDKRAKIQKLKNNGSKYDKYQIFFVSLHRIK